jgi:hypothetical protein
LILTPAEKRVAIFILAAFLLGLGTKCYRGANSSLDPSQSKLNTAQSPSATSITPAEK